MSSTVLSPGAKPLDAVEAKLSTAFSESIFTARINLQDIQKFDAASLTSLICFIREQSFQGKPIVIDLPKERRARDAMRQTQFSQIFTYTTGSTLSECCSYNSLQYFGEADEKGKFIDYQTAQGFANYLMKPDVRSGFTKLESLKRGDEHRGAVIIQDCVDKWQKDFSMQNIFLKANFRPGSYGIDTGIVFEGIVNAVTRKDASVVMSMAVVTGIQDKNPALEIAFWDNGKTVSQKSIKDTLQHARSHSKETKLKDKEMSLYLPVNLAVDVLNGEVSFISESYHMTARKAETQKLGESFGTYTFEEHARPENGSLTGNLVVYKLPLHMK
jgi:hypothetical protein